MGIVSSKLRNSAKGELCTFAIPGICNHDTGTVVLCHIRDDVAGKGTKANDFSAAFGCSACHEAIDQHRISKEDELFYSLRAMQRTLAVWVNRGLVIVPQDQTRAKPSSKIMSRRFTGNEIDPRTGEVL